MNTVTTANLLKKSTFLLALTTFSLLLSACGGDDKNGNASSSLSSSSAHSFIQASVTPPGTGVWPEVKVSAKGTKSLKFAWTELSVPVGTTYYKLLKKADSASSFQQVGGNINGTIDISDHTVSVSDNISVHLTDWLNNRYKIQACSDSACVDSAEVIIDSAMLSAITYVKASNTEADDWFGWSVAISGDGKTMAVGAPAEDSNAKDVNGDQTSNTSPNSGAVYIFVKDDMGNWQQQAYLKASNTEQPNGDATFVVPFNVRFGYRVSLSTDGNTLAVSALQENAPAFGVECNQNNATYTIQSSAAGYNPYNIGAVYIFNRMADQWSQNAYIKPLSYAPAYYDNSTKTYLQFGNSLSLSGDGKTLAVGAAADSYGFKYIIVPGVSSDSSSEASSDSNASTSVAAVSCEYLTTTNSSTSNSSVSSTPAPSSTNSSNNIYTYGGTKSGAVFVYTSTENGWIANNYLKAPDATAGSNFGVSVALSFDGKTLVVGADNENLGSNSSNATFTKDDVPRSLRVGAAYVFTFVQNQWLLQQKLKPSHPLFFLQFGASIAIAGNGNTIAIGAIGDFNSNGGVNPQCDDTSLNNIWVDALLGELSSSNADKLKVDAGAVYIFVNTNNIWSEEAYLKTQNPQRLHTFGNNVALSFNGDILAAGAIRDPSKAKGINGDDLDSSSANSGAAYLFTRRQNTWTQKSYIKSPNTSQNDRFGVSLGLDDIGSTLAVGAYRESSKATGVNGDQTHTTPEKTATASGAAYLF